jgi:cellulose synthase/poly-beta-1,6-N-acetylglucosamine synthase-like glycosyltransferase
MNRLCVLIPARNEELCIGGTIRSILAAGVQPSNIYVIDDGSTDRTGEIARSLGANVLRNEKNVGKARGIRTATTHFGLESHYEFLALMDADTRVAADYFERIEEKFRDRPDVGLVFGRVKNLPHNWITAYRCIMYSFGQFVYKDAQSKMRVVTVAPGCSSVYRTKAFAQLDWNNDTIVEDMDVTIQFNRKKLGRALYQSKAFVYTQDPRTLRDYIKQMYRWNTGTWQVGRKHHMLRGMARLDWEYKLLMGEGIAFSLLFLLLPLWIWLWHRAVYAIPMDMAVFGIAAAGCAVTDRRPDAILYAPFAVVLRVTDCAVFLYSFCETILFDRKIHGWFAVKRYEGVPE